MVEGSVNGFHFTEPLEPDGKGSHWLKFTNVMQKATDVKVGDTVALSIAPVLTWPDPAMPEDLKSALTSVPKANALWKEITPNARWDWIRWIRITKQLETRKRRIEIACSKLKSGMRRPCCFNRNLCSEPEVCKNGILLEPTPLTK